MIADFNGKFNVMARLALDQISDAVIALDQHKHIVYWNEGAKSLYGWTATEVIDRSILMLRYNDEQPRDGTDQVVDYETVWAKRFWNGKLVHRTLTGERVVVASKVVPLLLEGDSDILLMVNKKEQTQLLGQLQACENQLSVVKAKLAVAEHQVDALLEQSPIGIQFFNKQGLNTYTNEAACMIYGLDDRNNVLNSYNILNDELIKDNPIIWPYVQAAYRGNTVMVPNQRYPIAPRWKTTKSEVLLRTRFVPLKDAQGHSDGIMALVEDVSDWYDLVQNALQAKEIEIVSIISAKAANNFSKMLADLASTVEVLQADENLAKSQILNIKGILKSGNDLVVDLLDFTHKSETDTSVREIAMNKVLYKSINLFKPDNELTISIDAHPSDFLTVVKAPTGQLQKALLNLLIRANSVTDERISKNNGDNRKPHITVSVSVEKFDSILPSGRKPTEHLPSQARASYIVQAGTNFQKNSVNTELVDFVTEAALLASNKAVPTRRADNLPGGTYVRLSVEDNGIGIPLEQLRRVLEPLYLIKSGGGSSLDLAVLYFVARNHKGWLEISSSVSLGTKISLYLPAVNTK